MKITDQERTEYGDRRRLRIKLRIIFGSLNQVKTIGLGNTWIFLFFFVLF